MVKIAQQTTNVYVAHTNVGGKWKGEIDGAGAEKPFDGVHASCKLTANYIVYIYKTHIYI